MMHTAQLARFDDQPVTLHLGEQTWKFSITGVTRVGHDLFISIALTGAE
jgi:hypothetical protein